LVEHQLPKLRVASSSLVSRFVLRGPTIRGTMYRVLRRVKGLLAVGALALVCVASASAGWAGSDPAHNYPIGKLPATCGTAPTGKACVNAGIYYLDKARAKLAQPTYKLPADFPSLTAAQQTFILSNLDRVQYGLPPMTGLTAQLNHDALTTGVQTGTDPSPSISGLSGWTGNWAAGYPNSPIAYEEWMYDDGLGSKNIDCTASNPSGCWGHRHNVLWKFGSGAVLGMGAATGAGPKGGRGYAMLLVGGTSAYQPTYTYTWSQAVADGAGTNPYNPGVPLICVVPGVVSKTLAAAEKAITNAQCAVGTITKKHSPYSKGLVISQSPAAGKTFGAGAKINLNVSLGP
jgi:PASTA domain-containing protein